FCYRRQSMKLQPSATGVVPGLVVGLGASAGGLEAFRAFLSEMPVGTGIAFVIVQHLSPEHPSQLTGLLAACTPLTVVEAEDGRPLRPDHVYVVPADATLTIVDARLRVERPRRDHRLIDALFKSLADDQGECGVAIVLSGLGSDGSVGATAV